MHQGQVHEGVNQQKGLGCNWKVLLLEEMGKGLVDSVQQGQVLTEKQDENLSVFHM